MQPYPLTSKYQSFKPAGQEADPAITPGNPLSSFAKASGNTTVYKTPHSHDAAKPSSSHQLALEGLDDLVPFATPQDEQRYRDLAKRIDNHPLPNARQAAKAFIKERLGADGDTIVLAHFPNDEARAQGKPDSTQLLTDAVMDAFTGLQDHDWFPTITNAIGNTLFNTSPARFVGDVSHSNSFADGLAKVGKFLAKMTGPGWAYCTFVAKDNPVDQAKEQLRDVDNAYGLFKNNGKGYSAENSYELKPSELYNKFRAVTTFSELPYIKTLDKEISDYWKATKEDWPTAARMALVVQARDGLNNGTLSSEDYKLVMKGLAPGVPLKASAPVTFEQISKATPPDPSVIVQRFDINGYQATNILRVKRADGSGVMYVPGNKPPFVPFRHKDDELNWVKVQAKDAAKKEALLGHFSRYNRMDRTFYSGVETGLDRLADGSWAPAYLHYNDHTGKNDIKSDVFQDMRTQTEERLNQDATMETNNAWDGWKKTISEATVILGPLGGPVQMGLGIDGVLHPKNTEDLKNGVMDIIDGAIYTALDIVPRVAGAKPGRSGHYDVHKAEISNATGGDAQGTVASDAALPVSLTGYRSHTS